MMLKVFLIAIVNAAVFPLGGCQSSKVHDLAYRDFKTNDYDACVRLLNGSAQIGCQSSSEGNVGVLFHINTSQSVEDFFNRKFLKSYVPLVHVHLFNRTLVRSFIASGKVKGVIVYESKDFMMTSWSPDVRCIGDRFGLYDSSYGKDYQHCKENVWNPDGDGLTEEDIPFPVFHVKSDYQTLIDCYNEHNVDEDYPLCAVKMKSYMFGAVDSITCTRRTNLRNTLTPAAYCDPLGGNNVFSSLKLLTSEPNPPDSTILLIAPIDARSFMSSFQAPGVDLATGFITLLAVSQALGQLTADQKTSLKKNIVFVILDGEAFDNIGSTRMVYDMKNGEFPMKKDKNMILPPQLNLTHVSHVVEFRSLAFITDRLWVHYDPLMDNTHQTQIDEMVKMLNKHSPNNVNATKSSGKGGLAPSSLQNILKERNITSVVMTDYDENFTNRFYFSRYDTLKKLNISFDSNTTDDEMMTLLQPLAQKLSGVATMTTRMVLSLAGDSQSQLSADVNKTAQLLFCYLYKPNCTLFQEVIPVSQIPKIKLGNVPFKRYVSVHDGSGTLAIQTGFAHYLLSYFTGEKRNLNESSCKDPDAKNKTVKYYYFNGERMNSTFRQRVCLISSSFTTQAVVPAFEQNKVNQDTAAMYGLWTESRWSNNAFHFTMFLIQDEVSQGMTLLAGLFIFVTSFIAVYFTNTKANVLFQTNPSI